MELGEFVFVARGELGSLCPAVPEMELQVMGQGKRALLQLMWRQQGDDGSLQVLATVDRKLTNHDAQLHQNRRGVSNPCGQLESVLAAGLADAQVVSLAQVAPGVMAVRATVHLLPAAFDIVVPEQTSRAAANLGQGAVAAAAAASVAAALLGVVEVMREREEPGDGAGEGEGDASLDDYAPSTSTGVREGGEHITANGGGAVGPAAGSARRVQAQQEEQQDDTRREGDDESHHQYSDVRDEIFEIVAPRDWHTTHPNPEGLKCKLFPYQQRALSWMVWRETQPELGPEPGRREDNAESEEVVAAATAAATAHLGDYASQDLFWHRVEVRGGQELWANPYPGGGLRREPPPPPRRQRVGILADEMGLGKTVEVIALMLARRQQQQDGALEGSGGGDIAEGGGGCPHRGPNLIVTPASILQQWSYEIANHSNLKVYVYDGLRWHRQQSEDKEKERIKEAQREARLAVRRQEEAKRQERARKVADRAAALAAKVQVRKERVRARSASTTHGSARSRARRRGNDGRCLERETDTEEEEQNGHDDEDMEEEGEAAAGASGALMESGEQGIGRAGQLQEAGPSHAGPSMSGGAPLAGGNGHPLAGDTAVAAPNGTGPAARLGEGGSGGANDVARQRRAKLRVKFAAGVHSPEPGAGTGTGTLASTRGQQGPGGTQAAPNGMTAGHDGGNRAGSGAAAAAGASGRHSTRAPRKSYAAMQNMDYTVIESDDGDDDYHVPKRSGGRDTGRGRSRRCGAGSGQARGVTAAAATLSGSAGAAAPSAAAAGCAAGGSTNAPGIGPGSKSTAPAGAAGGSAAAAAVPSRMELYQRELTAALFAGTSLCPPSCDPQAESRAAVQELLSADVVLTTYAVLQEEVHYSPSNRVLSGLRHEKKYSVPESPLLQVRWHRLVLDEAQQVGGSYSHVVQMAARIEATHRWCVTGTPIGKGGLDDLMGLLCVLKYTPYNDPAVFKHLISTPFRSGSAEGHSRLAALIKPIMWRNSKAVAAQDHPLPRRVLQEAHLRFSAAEETFYDVVLGQVREAYNKMTRHRQQETLQRTQQHQLQPDMQPVEEPQGARRSSGLIDLTANDEGQTAATNGNHNGAVPSNQVGTGHQSSAAPSKRHAPGKRRRGQDRGEVLAQLAGGELQQLRLACVHVRLTSHWKKLGQELGLGGSTGPPAIDDVMARLRDQAQLHLQNGERDLCMVLNALASRLEATARKVQALAAKRLLQEAASPGGKAGAARQAAAAAAAAAAGAATVEAWDEEPAGSAEKPRAKKARGRNHQPPRDADDVARDGGGAAAATTAAADAAADGEAQGGDGDGTAAGGGGGAYAVHPFRYNGSGKTAAALSADAEAMLRECKELLEASWNVGENGIEAAAAAEGEAAAAAAAGAEDLGTDIKAASASIRSWRFVQANASQMLADLLSTNPELYTPCGDVSAAGPSAAPSGAALASAPEDSAAAAAPVASTATAASLRAAELRAYVSSRVTDVRTTADRELQRARERLDRINAAITRLQKQLVEDFGTAVAHGLPDGVVPEATAWLEDVQARLEAARQVEAARRAEQQASAAAGATLALMGKEVGALLSLEEAAVTRQRVGLDAAAGSLLVAAAVERLRAAGRGLRVGHGQGHAHGGQHLEQGPDWRSVHVGGVAMLLPPEGTASLVSDPHLAARAEWCLSYPPALGLLRTAVSCATEVEAAEMAARGIAHGFDQMTLMLCERHLRHPTRMLDSRLQEQRKTADHQGTSKLLGHGLVMLLPALEAVRLRIELLRTWKDQNTAELLVEVAEHHCEAVTGEVMAAAQGQVTGMQALLRLSEEDLRTKAAELKGSCEEQRHKKSFYHNQYLDATRLRHGAPGPAAAAAAGSPAAAGSASRHLPAAQTQDHDTPLAAAKNQPLSTWPANNPDVPVPGTATAATGFIPQNDNSSAAAAGSSPIATGAGGSGEPAPSARAPAVVARPSTAGTNRPAHVGVALRTGITACLHPWEQWRPGCVRSDRNTHAGRRAAPAAVLDLTGEDNMDVATFPPLGGPASTAAPGGSTAAAAVALKVAAQSQAAAGPAGPQAIELREHDVPSGERRESPEPSPPAAGAPAPTEQAAGNPSVDRGPAAAAAVRARLAAEMAAARARLALGLDSGMDADHAEEEGGLSCAVCANPMTTDIRLFPCGHYYCASCSDTLLGTAGISRCPTCRSEVQQKDVIKVGGISAPTPAGPARPGAGSEGSGEVNPPEGRHILSVKVERGSELMCKISALMRRLVWLRDHRPAEKSLVFSQWPEALKAVEDGLKYNTVGFVHLGTGRKIRAAMSTFLNDDCCRVFLLSLRQGAAGLTLVRANHVFLLEPSLDPAIEQQAVARVHRIGQTRDVTVTRLLVDGTVEEAVMRMLKEKQQLFMEGVAGSNRHSGAGPSTSAAPRAGAGSGAAGLAPSAVPLLEGGEGEEASLQTAAPRQEVLAGADMSYLLNAVLL